MLRRRIHGKVLPPWTPPSSQPPPAPLSQAIFHFPKSWPCSLRRAWNFTMSIIWRCGRRFTAARELLSPFRFRWRACRRSQGISKWMPCGQTSSTAKGTGSRGVISVPVRWQGECRGISPFSVGAGSPISAVRGISTRNGFRMWSDRNGLADIPAQTAVSKGMADFVIRENPSPMKPASQETESPPADPRRANTEPTLNEDYPREDPPGKESPPPPLTKEQQPGDYIRTKEPPGE